VEKSQTREVAYELWSLRSEKTKEKSKEEEKIVFKGRMQLI